MKNLTGLPENWCIAVSVVKDHPRYQEFKEWYGSQWVSSFNWEACSFVGIQEGMLCARPYGPIHNGPLLNAIIISPKMFFEALDATNEIESNQIEVSQDGKHWIAFRYFRQPEVITKLKLEDAKAAYIKALNLEGKNIEWI